FLALPRMIARLGLRRTASLMSKLAKGLREPMHELATTQYYGGAAIRCGDYAVRFTLQPRAEAGKEESSVSKDGLANTPTRRLAEGPVAYDLRFQFYVDAEKTPIEDTSVEWREADAPFVSVGRLTLLKQDVASAGRKLLAEYIETLSFDPWHALEEHRPL